MSYHSKANRFFTPGQADPTITVDQIRVPGFDKSRRPTIWQELKLKSQAMKLYGIKRTPSNWKRYTLDHLIPISLGGEPLSLLNAWPQRKVSAKAKDIDEGAYLRAAKSGAVLLADAQEFFVLHWCA